MNKIDFIGDIHGQFEALHLVLTKLGYKAEFSRLGQPVPSDLVVLTDNPDIPLYYTPPKDSEVHSRFAVFLGDLVDKGPEVPAVLQIVHNMHARRHAYALLGNHELRFLKVALRHKFITAPWNVTPYDFVYVRDTFSQLGLDYENENIYRRIKDKARRRDTRKVVAWMDTHLAAIYDSPLVRAGHAYPLSELDWDKHMHPGSHIREDGFRVSSRLLQGTSPAGAERVFIPSRELKEYFFRNTTLDPAVTTLKLVVDGPALQLPANVSFVDKTGITRTQGRIRWWAPYAAHKYGLTETSNETVRRITCDMREIIPKPTRIAPAKCTEKAAMFFGHYLRPLQELEDFNYPMRALCLDYEGPNGETGVTAYTFTSKDPHTSPEDVGELDPKSIVSSLKL